MADLRPEIRFAGYEDPWIRKNFNDLYDIFSNNTLSRDKLNYESGAALNVHYGDILIKFGEYLDVHKERLPYINDETVIAKFQNAVLQDGDIIIADTAEDETVGKCTEIGKVGEKVVLSGLHTIPCRTKQSYSAKYLGYCMNSEKYQKKLLPLMQGVKVLAISRSGILGTDVTVTENNYEQADIGNFLASLDELLKLEAEKLEKMKILKQTMLKKLFPQKGKKVPEIRFDGFTDDWEQRKLGELVDIGDIDHRMPSTVDEGIPYLMTGDFCGINELNFQGVKLISEQDYELLSRKIKPEKGDIIFARYASVGAVRYVDFTRKFLISYSCAIIKQGRKIESKFLYHYLTSREAQRQIKVEINAGSQANVGIDSMKKNIIVSMPKAEEQMKIADFLSNIDYFTSLHQNKIDKLQHIKSACMKKMFV